MKVVAINGSPRKGGNISQCLDVMAKEFEREGIEFEVVQPGAKVHPVWHVITAWAIIPCAVFRTMTA